MSASLLTPIESARHYMDTSRVEVGNLYTASAFGTTAAKFLARYPDTCHVVSLPCGSQMVHLTVEPCENGTGHFSYGRVVGLAYEAAEAPEQEEGEPVDFAAL